MPRVTQRVAARMNRLTTVRSRRMMLYAVCSVAVMLGAVGKSMIDGLSAPDINLDTAMVSGTASPALPALSPPSQPVLVSPSAKRSVPSAPIISRPSINERSLPDTHRTQLCSAHSRSPACTHSRTTHAAHPAHRSHTSHSTHHPAWHAQTVHAEMASISQTGPAPRVQWNAASATSANTHRAHGDHYASEATVLPLRQYYHH